MKRVVSTIAVITSLAAGCSNSSYDTVAQAQGDARSDARSDAPAKQKSPPQAPLPGTTSVAFKETQLGRVGPRDKIVGFACSPDSRRLILAVERAADPARIEVLVDGESSTVADVAPQSIVFSGDGGRYAYAVVESSKGRMVIDGKMGPPYDDVSCVMFSSGGKRAAYICVARNRCRVVLDGEEQDRSFAVIRTKFCSFSPDGSRFAYMGKDARGMALVVDGKERNRISLTAPFLTPTFSPDGKRLLLPYTNNQGEFVIHGENEELPAYDAVLEGTPVFSTDGRRVAYGCRKKDRWHLVVDGKMSEGYERMSTPVFSPDGSRVASVVTAVNGQTVLQVDGREVARHHKITTPVFSPDGRRLAYIAAANKMVHVEVDGQPDRDYDVILPHTLQFSSDGKRLAYMAMRGDEQFCVIDGKESRPFLGMFTFAFSPVASRAAYTGKLPSGATSVVVDGKEGEAFDDLLSIPVFSPDGRRVAYLAKQNGILHVVVNDDWNNTRFAACVRGASLEFSGNDRFHTLLSTQDGDFVRLEGTVAAP